MLDTELAYLYNLMREGIKLDLGIMRAFADSLGHPENDFKSIHVAGTNGKGSTAAYIFNIMRQKQNAGLYTSPHLVRFNERIIFNQNQIRDSDIRDFISSNRPTIDRLALENRNPTFFEATTMMAFQYFSKKKADYASIEVGLGGRLDSTNIITPEVSVITQIGYEHADKLGCSLTSIATEKGGIIKKNVPVVLSDTKPEVVRTIKSICSIRDAELILSEQQCTVENLHLTEDGTSFSLRTPKDKYEISTPLLGEFQVSNIATSVLAVESTESAFSSKKDIEKGVKETRWPGRMEVIRKDPKVILDCSHNPPAAVSLVNTFSKIFGRKPVIVTGMLSDKDSYSYINVIRKISDEVIFTTPNDEGRAVDPAKLDRLYGHLFAKHQAINDPIDAYRKALGSAPLILVTGSIYLVGVIKDFEEGNAMPFVLN